MFRYPADRIPVAIILFISVIDFCLYFMVDHLGILALYTVIMLLPRANICAWNHHHQHTPTFKYKPLNRLLEFFYALHTGVTSNLWLLHHVLGHHHNYLDQSADESRWRRKSGNKMGELEYTINVAATAYTRGFRVGRRHPRIRRAFVVYTALTFAAVSLLVFFKPLPALLLFVLPMVSGLLFTAWTTYDHHSGLSTENEFLASRNNLNRFYNLVTGNLGYHTAHHHKQGVHWSKLPELHEQIKDKIPGYLIKHSAF